jgi:uncharacterized protein (DUF2062 family)
MKFSVKRFKNEIFQAGTPPRTTAFSLALGIWLAFSPIPGLHFVIAFVAARMFKLNGVVLILGVMIHNPWTMLPIHMLGLMIGDLVLTGHLQSLEQFQQFPIGELGLTNLFRHSFWHEHGPALSYFIRPFVVGHLIMNTVLALVFYRYTLYLLRNKKNQAVSP